MVLTVKDRDQTGRLFRLAVHFLSYADWYSLALYDAAKLVPSDDRTVFVDRISRGLGQAHRDCSDLFLSELSNLVTSNRTSIMEGAPSSEG